MRTPDEMLATGAAWLTEAELASLVETIARLTGALELTNNALIATEAEIARLRDGRRIEQLTAAIRDLRRH